MSNIIPYVFHLFPSMQHLFHAMLQTNHVDVYKLFWRLACITATALILMQARRYELARIKLKDASTNQNSNHKERRRSAHSNFKSGDFWHSPNQALQNSVNEGKIINLSHINVNFLTYLTFILL